MSDAGLLRDLRDPKWSRFKETGDAAARRIEDLRDERDYWKGMFEKAANRLLQIDPEVNIKSTTVLYRLRKLEGSIEEPKKKPNPWTDV